MSTPLCPIGLATLLFLAAGCGPKEEPLAQRDDESANDDAQDDAASADEGDDEGDGDDEGTSSTTRADASTPVAPPTATCTVPEFPQDAPAQPFEQLDARVVDQDGEGVPSVTAQICGLDLCLFGETDDLGYIHRKEPTELKRSAFKYGDGLRYAQFARLLTDGATYELGEQATVAFPPLSKSSGFAADEVVTSGDFELDLAGTQAKIDLLSFPDAEQHVFVASELDEARFPDAVPPDLGIEQVIALGPLKTSFCPPAALTWPNTPNWPADAAVEVLLHIVDTANHWGAYGTFASVAAGHVSADGKRITTDADSGLPELGVLGVRLSQ